MALDYRIPLMGNEIEIQKMQDNRLVQLADQNFKNRSMDMQAQEMQFNQQRQQKLDEMNARESGLRNQILSQEIALGKIKNMNAQEMAELSHEVITAAHMRALDGNPNAQAAVLSASRLNPQLKQRGLEILGKNPAEIGSVLDQYIELGQLAGILDRPNSGTTPAAIQIANELQNARKAGDTQRVNDLLLSAKSLEKGQGVDANGYIINLPGATDAVEDMSYSNEAGKQTAQNDVAKRANFPKVQASMEVMKASNREQIQRIHEAINLVSNYKTAGWGSVFKILPASDAKTLSEKLNTIKSNIGFDKLQEMRTLSPTGGALGQVSDFENRNLQSVKGSLEQSQDGDVLISNLKNLERQLLEGESRFIDAVNRDFADVMSQQAAPNASPPTAGATPPANGAIDYREYFK